MMSGASCEIVDIRRETLDLIREAEQAKGIDRIVKEALLREKILSDFESHLSARCRRASEIADNFFTLDHRFRLMWATDPDTYDEKVHDDLSELLDLLFELLEGVVDDLHRAARVGLAEIDKASVVRGHYQNLLGIKKVDTSEMTDALEEAALSALAEYRRDGDEG